MKTELWRRLQIEPGVTAVIGSGGKTGLLQYLAKELPGTVILCTSTRIYPMEGMETVETVSAPLTAGCICVGTPAEQGKLSAPRQSFEELARLADYVLVEADGSRGLPLKAHLPHEPVIPVCAGQTIQVLGLWGLGLPIKEAAHRPQRYAQLCGCPEEASVTAEMAAAVINGEGLCTRVLLNGPESAEARRLDRLLQVPSVLENFR